MEPSVYGLVYVYLQYIIIFSISSVSAVYQRLWGLRTGRKGPSDLYFFHVDLVLAVRYNCHAFSYHNSPFAMHSARCRA
jgi:hypothetical protein